MATRKRGRPPASGNLDRRAQILDAASALVTEGGYSAATVRAVAARAGLGASTIRYYFPSQDHLCTAIAQQRLTTEIKDFRIDEAEVPAVDRLVECFMQFLPPTDERIGELDMWFAFMSTAMGPSATPLGKAMLTGMTATARERSASWLSVLASEGWTTAVPEEQALNTLWSRLDGLAMALLTEGSVATIADAVAIMRHDVERLLRRQDSEPTVSAT